MDTESVSLEEALATYNLEWLGARNAAALTRRAYLQDLTELVDFLTANAHLTKPSQVGLFHLERHLARLDQKGLSGNYRRRKTAAIRSFFAFCATRGFVQKNPSLELTPPAREEREPRFLTELGNYPGSPGEAVMGRGGSPMMAWLSAERIGLPCLRRVAM